MKNLKTDVLQCGKGAIMKLGDRPVQKISVVSSGSIGFDIALGVGGREGILKSVLLKYMVLSLQGRQY